MASAQTSDELPVEETYKNIADLLKFGYSYQEDVAVEGLFEDIVDHRSFLVGLTSRHLVFANVDFVPTFEISELTSLLPLKWLTITVADARLKILRVVYCTEKNFRFRFCDAEGDPEAVWLEFVSLITSMNLDRGVIWENPYWEEEDEPAESDSDTKESDDSKPTSSAESLPMFRSYFRSPRSRGDTREILPRNDSPHPKTPEDTTKEPEVTSVDEDVTKIKSAGDNELNLNKEHSSKIFTVNDLFAKVQEHHFGSKENPPQMDELGQTEMAKTIFDRKTHILENSISLNQKLNNDSDQWSTCSEEQEEEEEVDIFVRGQISPTPLPPENNARKSTRPSMRKIFLPRCFRKQKSTSDGQPVRWLMCCISKVEYD